MAIRYSGFLGLLCVKTKLQAPVLEDPINLMIANKAKDILHDLIPGKTYEDDNHYEENKNISRQLNRSAASRFSR